MGFNDRPLIGLSCLALLIAVLVPFGAAFPQQGEAVAPALVVQPAKPAGSNAQPKPFRLLGPKSAISGVQRAELLRAVLFSRITASKKAQEASNCSDRPQVAETPDVFVLPGQPGKTLSCSVTADAIVLIDHNGAICNESKKTKANQACVEGRLKQITEYSITLDGINLGAQRFKTVSEPFVVTTKDGNAFGFAPGKWKIIAAGWPVSIDRLSIGQHKVVTRYRIGDLPRQTIRVNFTVSA